MVTFFNETETGYFESLHIKLYTENGRDKIWLKAKRINAHRKLDKYGKNKKKSKGKKFEESIYRLRKSYLHFQSTPISFSTILYFYENIFL
jgi:hypothetical protein